MRKTDPRNLMLGNSDILNELSQAAVEHIETIRRLRDDVIKAELRKANDILVNTAVNYGTVWLCGSAGGSAAALDIAQKLIVATMKGEKPTRANALGRNTISYFSSDSSERLSSELAVRGYNSDCLWCIVSGSTDEEIINAAKTAKEVLRIPVIVFSGYPGAPLVYFADAKIQIQAAGPPERKLMRVSETHSFLANVLCTQLKYRQLQEKHRERI